MITAITIVLGDNDFGSVFRNMLDTLENIIVYRGNATEEQMTVFIHEGIRFHYIAFQQRYDLGEDVSKLDIDSTVKYLQEGITIYYNEEAFKKCEEDWDGGAWCLDIINHQSYYL